MALRANVRIEGDRALLRATRRLPRDAQREQEAASLRLSSKLARLVRAAGRAEGRQARSASTTVAPSKVGGSPAVTAGERGSAKARAVLLGSEFGATRHFGWYSRARYFDSVGKQFRPHRGRASYWFFDTVERNDRMIGAEYAAALDDVAERWGRGG